MSDVRDQGSAPRSDLQVMLVSVQHFREEALKGCSSDITA
jgi:hypothetical protein